MVGFSVKYVVCMLRINHIFASADRQTVQRLKINAPSFCC